MHDEIDLIHRCSSITRMFDRFNITNHLCKSDTRERIRRKATDTNFCHSAIHTSTMEAVGPQDKHFLIDWSQDNVKVMLDVHVTCLWSTCFNVGVDKCVMYACFSSPNTFIVLNSL